MAMIEPAAKAVASKELKKKAEKKVLAKKPISSREHDPVREKAQKREPDFSGAKRKTRKFVSENRPRMWKAPHSYAVRKYHNMLIAMWFAGSLIIASEFLDQNNDSTKIWKQMFAFQATMFILSWLVLIDVLTEIVAWFSVLVVIALSIAPGRFSNIASVIAGFGNKNKISAPTNSGNNQRIQSELADFQKPIINRNNIQNATDANNSIAPPQNAPGSNSDYFNQIQST